MHLHSITLLPTQILHGSEPAVVNAGLATLTAIVATLCPDQVAGFAVPQSHFVASWGSFMQASFVLCWTILFRVHFGTLSRSLAFGFSEAAAMTLLLPRIHQTVCF